MDYVIHYYVIRIVLFITELLSCSSIFICFRQQQLWLAEIYHVFYFSQSQLMLAKTNEDWTACRKALSIYIRSVNIQLQWGLAIVRDCIQLPIAKHRELTRRGQNLDQHHNGGSWHLFSVDVWRFTWHHTYFNV